MPPQVISAPAMKRVALQIRRVLPTRFAQIVRYVFIQKAGIANLQQRVQIGVGMGFVGVQFLDPRVDQMVAGS